MKKNILLAICLFTSVFSFAQIKNGSFENWTNVGNYQDPDSFKTPNQYSSIASVFLVTKSSSAHNESNACDLTTQHVNYLTINGDYPGIITNGNINISYFTGGTGSPILGGKKINYRPDGLTGWFKYSSVQGDSAFANIVLTKWITGVGRDTVGTSNFVQTTSQTSYARLVAPITYKNATVPDTFQFIFTSSGRYYAHPGSVLTLDSLSTYPAAPSGINTINSIDFSILPNPSNNFIKVQLGTESNKVTELSILNLTGQTVYNSRFTNNSSVNVSNLSNGKYFVMLSNGREIVGLKEFVVAK